MDINPTTGAPITIFEILFETPATFGPALFPAWLPADRPFGPKQQFSGCAKPAEARPKCYGEDLRK